MPHAEGFEFKSEDTGYALNISKPGCGSPSSFSGVGWAGGVICGVLLTPPRRVAFSLELGFLAVALLTLGMDKPLLGASVLCLAGGSATTC